MTKLFKTIAYFCATILIAIAIFFGLFRQADSQFQLLGGESRSLADYEGRWLVVNFWAEWCAPCREELPDLNRLAMEGKNGEVSVIGISYDALDNAQLLSIVEDWGFKYPVLATEPMPILPFGLPAQLPTNYLIAPDGTLVKKLVGKQDYHSLSKAIELARQSLE